MSKTVGADLATTTVELARERSFRRNLLAVSLWELVWGFGAACVAGPIITALALQLTPAKAVIGLLGLMQALAVPSLLVSAYLNRRLRQRRWFVAGCHVVQVTNWLLLGLACLLPGVDDGALLAGLVVAHGVIYLLSGLLTAPTYELLSGAFGRRYGTAAGVQLLVNRTAGVLGGLMAERLLTGGDVPANFGRVLLVGSLCLMVSNLAVLGMVETPLASSVPPAPGMTTYLAGLGTTVGRHREYLVFLGVVVVLAFVTVVQGFYTTYALEELGLPLSQAGLFTAVIFAATGLGGLSGILGDRWGHRRLLIVSLLLYALATAVVMTARVLGVPWFYAGLAASGVAVAASSIASTNLMVDFAPPGERGAYAAVGRLATLAAGAACTPLSGWLIDGFGYGPVFWCGIALPVLGSGVALLFRDPRHGPQPR